MRDEELILLQHSRLGQYVSSAVLRGPNSGHVEVEALKRELNVKLNETPPEN